MSTNASATLEHDSRKSSELFGGRTDCDGVEELVVDAELEQVVRALQQADLWLQKLGFKGTAALLNVGRRTHIRAPVAIK